MGVSVDYSYYSEVYGGMVPEAAFDAVLPGALRHVGWLCGGQRPTCSERTPYKRAVCAVADVFAQYGKGQVGGFAIGDFRMTQYEGRGSLTGVDLANLAAEMELCGTSLLFCGVR